MSGLYTATDHFVLLPAILLALFGSAVLLFDAWLFAEPHQKRHLLWVVLLGLGFTGHALWRQWQELAARDGEAIAAFGGTLLVDPFSLFFNAVFLVSSLLVALASYRYLEIEREGPGEYYGLVLLAQCGMYFLAAGADLVTLFLGLELMAVCFYVLVGYLRGVRRSNEAAVKYLLLGAFSSGFLAYGFSLLYGLSGSTRLADIAPALAGRDPFDPLVFLALATTAVGLLFKISAVPFHMWAPDAYEGAPTTVTAFLSVASKAASLAFLIRLFLGPLAALRTAWEPMLIVVAVLSLTLGNLAALSQANVKRLLAYSSIAHVGYILLGLIAGNETGLKGIAVYVLVYTFMNLGALLVLVALRRRGVTGEHAGEHLDDLTGLARHAPGHAALMLVFLVSLAGIPPTAGFLGKYFIFLALVETGHYGLAVAAVLYVAVSAYFYFRLVRVMFAEPAVADAPPLATSWGLRVAVAVAGVATVGLFVYPEWMLRWAEAAMPR